ncbi:MAG: polysaccharide biosynthesis/export family protein [Giesbergeria sp.]
MRQRASWQEAGAVPSVADSDYKITPSDLLEIEVFGVSELKRTVRVNTSGQIAMPLIGTISVAGLTPSDAEALIALQYAGKNFLQDPQVSIFVKEFTTQRITLDGALNKPGVYPLTGQISLLRALGHGGGRRAAGRYGKRDAVSRDSPAARVNHKSTMCSRFARARHPTPCCRTTTW